jgi:hypothetical protein
VYFQAQLIKINMSCNLDSSDDEQSDDDFSISSDEYEIDHKTNLVNEAQLETRFAMEKFNIKTIDRRELYNKVLDFCEYYDHKYGDESEWLFFNNDNTGEINENTSLYTQLGKEHELASIARTTLVGINSNLLLISIYDHDYTDDNGDWSLKLLIDDLEDCELKYDTEATQNDAFRSYVLDMNTSSNFEMTIIDYVESMFSMWQSGFHTQKKSEPVMCLDIRSYLDTITKSVNEIQAYSLTQIRAIINQSLHEETIVPLSPTKEEIRRMKQIRVKALKSYDGLTVKEKFLKAVAIIERKLLVTRAKRQLGRLKIKQQIELFPGTGIKYHRAKTDFESSMQ